MLHLSLAIAFMGFLVREDKLQTMLSSLRCLTECLWSGQKDDKRSEGVAIAMAPAAAGSLASWTPINERLFTARFQHQRGHLTVIVIYAPTEDDDQAKKDSFYGELDVFLAIPRGDLIECLGDLNAVPGSDRLQKDQVLRPYGSVIPNDNLAIC